MIKLLGVTPNETIILEDSNLGIESAKKSGAFVIGYRGNLTPGYIQKNADTYVDTIPEVVTILKKKRVL